jgi:FKBP-type peptidyl-prolyl cis-trans isomerase 2
LAGSLLAFLVPAFLLAGFDLSGLLYPSSPLQEPQVPGGGQVAPVVVGPGSAVTLEVVGTLDNGSVFLEGRPLQATVGDGTLVRGLEAALAGLKAGDTFDVTVAPADGFGLWDDARTRREDLDTTRNRVFKVEAGEWDEDKRPQVGDVVTRFGDDDDFERWPATVINASGKYITFRYDPQVGDTFRLNRYWNSTVTGFNDTDIFLRADVWVGYTYTRFQRSLGQSVTYRVVDISGGRFTLDYNHPLAGQTLHFAGKVLDVAEGGPVAAAPPTVTANPVLLSGESCARCHGGFTAVDAWATGVRRGGRVVVNVTVEDPWNHQVTAGSVSAALVGATGPGVSATASLPPLARGDTTDVTLDVEAPAGAGNISITVDATAYHAHTSSASHDSSSYQVRLLLPVAAEGGNGSSSTGTGTPDRPSSAPAPDNWALVGRALGFAAFAMAALPAFMGGKRHVRLPPRYRFPPWLTTHFTLSLASITLAAAHGAVLMSGAYRGEWSVPVLFGVASILLLGSLGVSGIVLAKWVPLKWQKIRKAHFWLMSGMIGAAVVHVVVSSTTLHDLLGY